MVFPNVQRFLGGFMKRHSQAPSFEWFKENLAAIVARLRAETRARIALSSLGPIGESPDSTDPNQRRLNDLVAGFSATIKQAAAQHGTDYIPFYERLSAEIAATPGKALTTFRFLDRKSTRLNSSHSSISYAVFCLKKKIKKSPQSTLNTLV